MRNTDKHQSHVLRPVAAGRVDAVITAILVNQHCRPPDAGQPDRRRRSHCRRCRPQPPSAPPPAQGAAPAARAPPPPGPGRPAGSRRPSDQEGSPPVRQEGRRRSPGRRSTKGSPTRCRKVSTPPRQRGHNSLPSSWPPSCGTSPPKTTVRSAAAWSAGRDRPNSPWVAARSSRLARRLLPYCRLSVLAWPPSAPRRTAPSLCGR